MALEFRLRKHAEFQRVYKTAGRKQFGKLLAYFVAPRAAEWRSATNGARIGLTVPKAMGGAVDRNRIKRRLRAAVRRHVGLLDGVRVDVVFHPKRAVLDAEWAAVEREVELTFRAIRSRSGEPTKEQA
jgi:ribonuclease P protein component